MLEIIATTPADAIAAEQGGADRIELVSALGEGGLTPSYGMIEAVVNSVIIPVNVMVRPHSQSFVYDATELAVMIRDIEYIKQLGAHGVVLGLLDTQQGIDRAGLEQLLAVCDGLEVTFHRAIDETNHEQSLAVLADYPQITTVLTSGGLTKPIVENLQTLQTMMVASGHIQLLLGGGITAHNIRQLHQSIGTNHYHLGTAVQTAGRVDSEKVRQIKELIR